MKISAQYAFSHFEDISAAVERGEDVEIERPGKAGLHLVIRATGPLLSKTGRRELGALAETGHMPTVEEWAEMDKQIGSLMLDAPLMTTGEV